MPAHRFAIYLSPAEPLRSFGNQWLGRDAETGAPVALPPALASRPAQWVQAPAHYGLHATLKPPFRLAEGTDAGMLDDAARAFAQRQRPFTVPLGLRPLRGFLAWCLADDPQGVRHMHTLADACVREFDRFRAAPTPEEVARRKPEQLSEPEQRMLRDWGYPHLFETFTFHITLTGMLDGAQLETAQQGLSDAAGTLLAAPLPVNEISVFVQAEPGADFVVARHYAFDGTVRDGAGAATLLA